MTYRIVRFHMDGHPQDMARGLTLEQAQRHCNDPETSSATATSPQALAYTLAHGPWFDRYIEESSSVNESVCPSWHFLHGPYDSSDCPNRSSHSAQRAAWDDACIEETNRA